MEEFGQGAFFGADIRLLSAVLYIDLGFGIERRVEQY